MNEIDKRTKYMQELEKNRKIVLDSLGHIRSRKLPKEVVKEYFQNMRELMRKGTEEQRRSVVCLLFSSVIVNPKEAKFNFHSESYFFYQFVNRKSGVQADSELAPRFAIKANPINPVFSIVVKIPSAIQKKMACRTFRNPIIVAQELYDEMKHNGISQAELARRHGLSRARVHQWLSLLELPKKEIERLKAMGDNWEKRLLTERMLRNKIQCG